MDDPTMLEVAERLGLAVLLAAALGWDREKQQKAAGLRTHMLVSLGAAAFTLVGLEFMSTAAQTAGASSIDMSRIMQGIIGGIGFLGAGAIIQARGNVRGMTTAAGIWATAAIGTTCGFGEYTLAVMVTAIALFVLTLALSFERVMGWEKES